MNYSVNPMAHAPSPFPFSGQGGGQGIGKTEAIHRMEEDRERVSGKEREREGEACSPFVCISVLCTGLAHPPAFPLPNASHYSINEKERMYGVREERMREERMQSFIRPGYSQLGMRRKGRIREPIHSDGKGRKMPGTFLGMSFQPGRPS